MLCCVKYVHKRKHYAFPVVKIENKSQTELHTLGTFQTACASAIFSVNASRIHTLLFGVGSPAASKAQTYESQFSTNQPTNQPLICNIYILNLQLDLQ